VNGFAPSFVALEIYAPFFTLHYDGNACGNNNINTGM
jgi:hypothetical protein